MDQHKNINRPISIRDIADMAGVSIATVSRVINNNGRFSEATRERVQKVIDETGFVPNAAAKHLRESQSKTIGMIVPDISNDYYSTLALYTEHALSEADYSVFICNTENNQDRERQHIRTLLSKRVDGIMCISGTNALGEEVRRSRTPVICVDRYAEDDSDIPHIVSEDEHGAYLATKHLIEQGCTRILYICGSRMTDLNNNKRKFGYELALAEAKLPISQELHLILPENGHRMHQTEQLLWEKIQDGLVFDGVFTANDHIAVGALRALKKANIAVPDSVKIVGFDDSVYARLPSPALSSVKRFPEQLARKGCELILDRIAGIEIPIATFVPCELVVRESSLRHASL